MSDKRLIQAVKAMTNWNKGSIQFDKTFLKYQDEFELRVTEKDNIVTIETIMKRR